MPQNMGYCKYENTYYALSECLEKVTEKEDLSDREEIYKRMLLNLCKQFIDVMED